MDKQYHSEYERIMDVAKHYKRLAKQAKKNAGLALAAAYGIELGKTRAVYIEERNGKERRRKFQVDSVRPSYGDNPINLEGRLIKKDGSLGQYNITAYSYLGRWEIIEEIPDV